jgi:hypothetical protein
MKYETTEEVREYNIKLKFIFTAKSDYIEMLFYRNVVTLKCDYIEI